MTTKNDKCTSSTRTQTDRHTNIHIQKYPQRNKPKNYNHIVRSNYTDTPASSSYYRSNCSLVFDGVEGEVDELSLEWSFNFLVQRTVISEMFLGLSYVTR